jgi:hypothetical protein
MALRAEERKARRIAGMERAEQTMTSAQRIRRDMTNGRPPSSEMRSPTAAVGAARLTYRDLRSRMKAEGFNPELVKHGVVIVYVNPDLTALGYTARFSEKSQDALLRELEGKVPVGLFFGIHDPDPSDKWRVRAGTRAFLNTKQTEEWFKELNPVFLLDVVDPT